MNPSPESVNFFRAGFIPARIKASAQSDALQVRLEMPAMVMRTGVPKQQRLRFLGATNNACSHGNMFAHNYLHLYVFICLFVFNVIILLLIFNFFRLG